MILGTLPDAVGADATLYAEIEPGDCIMLYTDGLPDVFDSPNVIFRLQSRGNATDATDSIHRRCLDPISPPGPAKLRNTTITITATNKIVTMTASFRL
jgi:hypothetical protein